MHVNSSNRDNQILQWIWTTAIGLLVLHKALGVSKTLAFLGIFISAAGTVVLMYGEIKGNAAFFKYLSSGEGKSSFDDAMRNEPWYVRVVISLAVRLWGGTGRVEEFAESVGSGTTSKAFVAKVIGLFLLLFGFLLQLISLFVNEKK